MRYWCLAETVLSGGGRARILRIYSPPPMTLARSNLTALLQQWSDGRADTIDQLFEAIYAELRKLAGSYVRRERRDHTLQATALVHEAFVKLIDQRRVKWQSRAH